MNPNNVISVFEHSRLSIGEQGFETRHFDRLVKYNDQHKGKYFTIGYKMVIFKSYVGLIQIGDKVIEILPKADKKNNGGKKDILKWQGALLLMLQKAGYIKLNQTTNAFQHTRNTSLLDVYLRTFLQEVEKLIHGGLVKKYKRVQANLPVLKGRLLVEKQLKYNILHKEHFFTEHITYSRDNLYNRILKSALEIITNTSLTVDITQDARQLLLYFEDIESWKGIPSDFDKLKFDRKTFAYKDALVLAEMIILNYCPAFKAGQQQVLALLFDMNALFEKFIYKMLKEAEGEFQERELSVTAQNSQLFWAHKTIRPDILIQFRREDIEYRVVIDTKWKIVDENYPSDHDLRQMFTYNVQFNSDHAILLYPSIGQANRGKEAYSTSERIKGFSHACEMYFIELFDVSEGVIDRKIGKKFLDYLI
ncbi:McrC family protein [Chitinophaga sp. HK235]|uniref:McrC family protein n=1 Tax=Chitinophaga sp. HK235 TaxID=2952571 RepID=UPI001BAAC6DE|nr:hypothetical protein [Chitinophaga sp. HK235]